VSDQRANKTVNCTVTGGAVTAAVTSSVSVELGERVEGKVLRRQHSLPHFCSKAAALRLLLAR
jgi:hypothetical protein